MNKDNSTIKDLKRGVIWTLINRISVVGMQFIAMIVLARFITPSDFAVMGIATFFISISQTLLDSGMGGSLLRKQNIEDIDYSTLFIYNMGVGLAIYSLLLILAKPLAFFYNDDELSLIISVIGLSVVVSAFGKIQNIILFRELKFKEISIISIISSFIALLTAVILAIRGYGVWALVMQNLISSTLIVLLQFFCNRYFPRLEFSVLSFKEQWSYGSHLLYSHLLNTVYQNIFLMIFPKISSYSFSGLYAQANKIQQLPSNIINTVIQGSAFPVLAKIDDEKLFIQANKQFTRNTYIVSFTILFAISIFSKQIIVILLGNKWIEAAPMLSILSIGSIGVIVSMMVRNTLKSMGVTSNIFKIEAVKSIIGIIVLVITFFLGDYCILVGIVVTNYLSCFVAVYYLSKVSRFTVKEQLKDFFVSLLPVIPSAIVSYAFVNIISAEYVLTLLYGLFVFILLVVFFGIVFKNNEIKQVQKHLLLKLKIR